MEALYNKFGLEPYDMILVEGDGLKTLYSLGDQWFVYWNGFEYERIVEATEKFLADPQPYREAIFIEDDSLLNLARGISFATGYRRLKRVDDKLFGISATEELIPLDIPIEPVKRFEKGFTYDLGSGLMLSEVKEFKE